MNPPSRLERAAVWLLAALLFLLPLIHSGRQSDPFHLPKEIAALAAAFLLLAVGIASHLRDDAPTGRFGPAHGLAAIILLGAGIAAAAAVNGPLALWGWIEIAAGIVVLWATSRFVMTSGAAARLLDAVLASAAITAVVSILQVFNRGLHLALAGFSIIPPSRGGATLGDPGLLAQFLIASLPIGIGAVILAAPGARRLVRAGLLGLVVAALIFAGRPEGWVVAAGSVLLLAAARVLQVWLGGRRLADLAPDLTGEGLRALLAVVVVAAAVAGLSRLPGVWTDGRPAAPLDGVSLLTPTTGSPERDRPAAARGSLVLLGRHPIGVGPAHWRHAFFEVAWTAVDPSPFTFSHQAVHAGNGFLEVAVEAGVASGAALLLLVVVLLIQAGAAMTRAPGPWAAIGLAGCGAIATGAILALRASLFHEPAPALLFWMMAGLVQAAVVQAGPPGPARLAWLVPRERPAPPRPVRPVWPAWTAAAVCISAAAGVGWWGADRVRGAHLILAGQASYYAGQLEAALLAFGQPAARRAPDHLPHVLAASAYLRLGFPEQAEDRFTAALRRSPRFLAALQGRAAAREARGHYDRAEEDLRAALAIWPGNADLLLLLGRLNATRGRPDEALQNFRAALEKNSGLAEAYHRMGDIFLRRNQIDEAIEAYRECLSRDPRYPGAQISLGTAFFRKGMIEMALRVYQGAATADPRNAEVRLRIANSHHALGQPCEALEALRAAREMETDDARRESVREMIARMEVDCRRAERHPSPRR